MPHTPSTTQPKFTPLFPGPGPASLERSCPGSSIPHRRNMAAGATGGTGNLGSLFAVRPVLCWALPVSVGAAPARRFAELTQAVDTDRSGAIDATELQSALSSGGWRAFSCVSTLRALVPPPCGPGSFHLASPRHAFVRQGQDRPHAHQDLRCGPVWHHWVPRVSFPDSHGLLCPASATRVRPAPCAGFAGCGTT